MAAARLLRMSRPSGLGDSFLNNSCNSSSMVSGPVKFRCFCKGGFGMENWPNADAGQGERKSLEVKARVLTSESVITEPKTDKGVDVALLLAKVREFMLRRLNLNVVTKRRPSKLYVQLFIEKAIVDCRFFTLFAVAGSLLGSILCFVEGCFLILESYFEYFHALSQGSEQGHLVQLLIEAIDMFIVATSMLVFGMGLHVLFVGSSHLRGKGSHLSQSNYLKTLPSWSGTHSIMQAKSKIGHAVIMLLQVGVLEKFKSIPLVTGFDLACFAGAVFLSSACIFLLSKLKIGGTSQNR